MASSLRSQIYPRKTEGCLVFPEINERGDLEKERCHSIAENLERTNSN
jgi:hypothetical protein